MKRIITTIFLFFFVLHIFGQGKAEFLPPLDIPLVLSGNFGELRSNHFHSGLDFKTQGVTGHVVRAIDSGYVSRINIQPGGYGKAVYLAHPNGYTSVYGHLSSFSNKIDDYIRKEQYRRKTHAINIYPEPELIRVSRGEIIALSGNSGSSTGPHLHFEIRRTADQHPVNGLFFGFPVEDTIPPDITRLAIYPADHDSRVQHTYTPLITETVHKEGRYKPRKGNPYMVSGPVGIGVEVFDYLNGAPNRCGIYSLELFLDGNRIYYSEMNAFSFNESRFINAHIDYREKYENGRAIQQLFRKDYNPLSIYKQMKNDGIINLTDTLVHDLLVRATDSHGNVSKIGFQIRNSKPSHILKEKQKVAGRVLPFNAASNFTDRNIRLSFPAYCFYEDVPFRFARTGGKDGLLSDIFHIHDPSIPVHSKFKIAITPDEPIPASLQDKVCLAVLGKQDEVIYAGGEYVEGAVIAEVRSFGNYAVALDTVSPEITPLNMHPGKDMTGLPAIRFQVEDDFSGIAVYEGTIDGQWVLFEYDPKNDLVYYEFDNMISFSKKNHDLELRLEDAKGNMSNFRTTFFR